MKAKSKSLAKKLKKVERLVQAVATAAVVAMTIYNLIPKYEKINEIDGEKLAMNLAPENAEN